MSEARRVVEAASPPAGGAGIARADTDAIAQDADAIAQVDRAIRQSFLLLDALDRRALAASTPALTTAQYHTLAALALVPSQSLSELAARRFCDKANVSGLIDRLTEQGLASRTRDPHDKRRVALSLTPAGWAVLERATRVRSAALRRALRPLELSADLAGTGHALERLVELLQAAVAEAGEQPTPPPR